MLCIVLLKEPGDFTQGEMRNILHMGHTDIQLHSLQGIFSFFLSKDIT